MRIFRTIKRSRRLGLLFFLEFLNVSFDFPAALVHLFALSVVEHKVEEFKGDEEGSK